MLVQLLIDNPDSWIVPYATSLKDILTEMGYRVLVFSKHRDVQEGDVLILLSCERIFSSLSLNKYNLVIHESALPQGKGWSPLTWQVLEGKDEIPVTLFEATDSVDSGRIYGQLFIQLDGTELNSELKHKQGLATIDLIVDFFKKYPNIIGKEQEGKETFYPKRTVKDSELILYKTIEEQFNLLRVVDNERYPAFFIKNGVKYILKIYKA